MGSIKLMGKTSLSFPGELEELVCRWRVLLLYEAEIFLNAWGLKHTYSSMHA